jgi:NADH-quinone oxidoreductase subunit L
MTDLALIGPYAWLIPTFTAVAFLVIMAQIWTGRGNRSSAAIAIAGISASAVMGVLVFLGVMADPEGLSHHPEVFSRLPWLPMGSGSLDFGIQIDPLSAAVTAMVGIVCTMIFIYASSYMEGELKAYTDPKTGAVDEALGQQRYARFFAYVSLFATGMLGFVLASNLLQALVFWEIMGLCSFLLIGFWYYKPSAAAAAKKAFLTTRIGDMGFFVGIMALYWAFGTVDYDAMLSADGVARLAGLGNLPGTTIPLVTLFALLLFGGSVGKSAQFPLHVWLPDAMEGPTPVSAMIHAATMVSAGVFLIARLFPVFAALSPVDHPSDISGAMFVVAAIGAFTAVFAASIAVAQFDIKRVLAYSTISQLGYMVMALGIGAYVAAVFHLLTHAFFKALLFLGSGSVIHGVEHGFHHDHDHGGGHDAHPPVGTGASALDPHDPQDMRNMGGLASRMPLTFSTFLAGTLALTGVPIFAGFWSKDEILASAFYKAFYEGETGLVVVVMPLLVWLLGTLAAFLTAFYMSRQVFMVFSGKPATAGAEHAPESAPRMVWPLAFLAVFAVFLGLVGVPEDFSILGLEVGRLLGGNPFHHFMGTLSTGSHFAAHPFNAVPAALSIGAAFSGWALGYFLYGMEPEQARAADPLARLGGLWRLLNQKYYVDEAYDATFIRGTVGFAGLNSLFDRFVVDGLVNGVSMVSERLARANGWVDRVLVDGTVNLVAYVNNEMSRWLKYLQSGRVQQYLLVVFLGLLALLMPLVL